MPPALVPTHQPRPTEIAEATPPTIGTMKKGAGCIAPRPSSSDEPGKTLANQRRILKQMRGEARAADVDRPEILIETTDHIAARAEMAAALAATRAADHVSWHHHFFTFEPIA